MPSWASQFRNVSGNREGEKFSFLYQLKESKRNSFFYCYYFFKKHLPKYVCACHHIRKWTGLGKGDGNGERMAVC